MGYLLSTGQPPVSDIPLQNMNCYFTIPSLFFDIADAFSNVAASMGLQSDLVKTIPYFATLIGLAKTYKKYKEA